MRLPTDLSPQSGILLEGSFCLPHCPAPCSQRALQCAQNLYLSTLKAPGSWWASRGEAQSEFP